MVQSLEHLLDQNVTWATGKRRDDPEFFRRMAEQQTPSYLWIGCSDSRVTANDVLGLDPGEVFVHRNIANVVHTSDMNVLSALEFAVDHLRVEHIIVCGHYGCSGVRRALANERGAMLDHWLQPISMLYRKHRQHLAVLVYRCHRLVVLALLRSPAWPLADTRIPHRRCAHRICGLPQRDPTSAELNRREGLHRYSTMDRHARAPAV
jgi:carbonic anhydrase